MARFSRAIRDFIRQDDGAALVEYALLVALIAVVAVVVVTTLGRSVSQKFSSIAAQLT